MSIPTLQITDKGIIAPSTNEVMDGIWQLMKDAFGTYLNTALNTPQGQLVTSLTAMITDERNQMIELLNQFDPRYARGIWQEGLGAIYFIQRKKATHSTVEIECIGLAGTIIPKGFEVGDRNKHTWKTHQSTVINNDGKALVPFVCATPGAIAATTHSINSITQALIGLDRVSNPYPAIVGVEEETQEDFESRRLRSVANNAKNTNASTYSAIANIKDVIDVHVIDNPTDETIHVGSTQYPIIRNSILVSVVGGDDEIIAKTILTKAGSGCSFDGNTEVLISDTENFSTRAPSYIVKFLRPKFISLHIHIQLDDRSKMTSQYETKIKDAIISSLERGATKASIGQQMIASRFICKVAQVVPHLSIVSLKISKDGEEFTDVVEIGIDEYPRTTDYLIRVI